MSVICQDCEYSSNQLVWVLFTIYNAFTDTNAFDEKKCKVQNLFQLYLADCIDKTKAWKFDVSECGSFQFLTLIFTINGYSVNMVVYFDGIGYVLLNQGSCRIKYDNNKRITESVVQNLVTKGNTCGKSCSLKTNVLYAYDKKNDKVVSECNFELTPKVVILSPKKCQNINGKSTTLRFTAVDINFLNTLEYVVFLDGVEYIRLEQIIPVLIHFKNHGKHNIAVKIWDVCSQQYLAESCVDVKVEDKCQSSSTTCTDTSVCTTTSCTDTSVCTTTSCTGTTTSTTSCEPCKKGLKDTTDSTDTSTSCSLSEKNVKVVTYRTDTTDN